MANVATVRSFSPQVWEIELGAEGTDASIDTILLRQPLLSCTATLVLEAEVTPVSDLGFAVHVPALGVFDVLLHTMLVDSPLGLVLPGAVNVAD